MSNYQDYPLIVLTKQVVNDPGEKPVLREIRTPEELIGSNVVGLDFSQNEHPLFSDAYRRLRSRVGIPGLDYSKE